jgi:6-phospho-beta-glucosidase
VDGKRGETEFEVVPGIYQGVSNSYLDKTDWDWEIDSIGLRTLLNELNDRYQIPIIITENGIGAVDMLTEDEKVYDHLRLSCLSICMKFCKM